MADDAYARAVLATHESTSSILIANGIINSLSPSIITWANGHLLGIHPSGSVAKGTAIQGSSDVDILVSVSDTAVETLKQVYEKLFNRLSADGYSPRRQNVSLGVTIDGRKVDIVPAKRHSAWTTNHSIWSHKQQSWRETDIHKHVEYVTSSGRVDEIRLIKIWKKLHNLEFPSFPLEVAVIESLKWRSYGDIANNFARALQYIRDELPTISLQDPTKPSNILTDELTTSEKNTLSNKAREHLSLRWFEVLW